MSNSAGSPAPGAGDPALFDVRAVSIGSPACQRAMMGGMALQIPCPYCGAQMYAEQAHNRCPECRYIEPCCDGAPLAFCETRAPETAD